MPLILTTDTNPGTSSWQDAASVITVTTVQLLTNIDNTDLPAVTLDNSLTWNQVISTYDYIEWRATFDTVSTTLDPQVLTLRLHTSLIQASVYWPLLGVDADNSDPAGFLLLFPADLDTGSATIIAAGATLTLANLVAYSFG